jgi:hypothetical protein
MTGIRETARWTIKKVEPQTTQTSTSAISAIIGDDFQFFKVKVLIFIYSQVKLLKISLLTFLSDQFFGRFEISSSIGIKYVLNKGGFSGIPQ